jgi:hypothetical protein
MAREKKDRRKTRIMIRMTKAEKTLSEVLSKAANKSTSEYLRYLMKEAEERKLLEVHLKIIEQQKQVIHELSREFLRIAGKKARG